MQNYTKENLLFCVDNTEYYRDGEKMIALYPEGTKGSIVMQEAANMSRAMELGISVPTVLEVKQINSRWAIVTEYVGSTLLSDLAAKSGWGDDTLTQFLELEMSVHSKKSQEFPKQRDILQRKISGAVLDGTVRYKLHTSLEELPKHNKLCHGRLLPTRVIVGEDGKYYLFNWLSSSQGNSSADASCTYLSLYLDFDSEIAERYLTGFLRRSEISRSYVERWLPIAGAAMLNERSEEEQNMLMKFIKK